MDDTWSIFWSCSLDQPKIVPVYVKCCNFFNIHPIEVILFFTERWFKELFNGIRIREKIIKIQWVDLISHVMNAFQQHGRYPAYLGTKMDLTANIILNTLCCFTLTPTFTMLEIFYWYPKNI